MGNIIDISKIKAPQAVEVLDFEDIFLQQKAQFLTITENQEDIRNALNNLLQVLSFEELKYRQRLNNAVLASFLPYAQGEDLDNRALDYNITRAVINGVLEDDESLRNRCILALDSLNGHTAGKYYQNYFLFKYISLVDQVATRAIKFKSLAIKGDKRKFFALDDAFFFTNGEKLQATSYWFGKYEDGVITNRNLTQLASETNPADIFVFLKQRDLGFYTQLLTKTLKPDNYVLGQGFTFYPKDGVAVDKKPKFNGLMRILNEFLDETGLITFMETVNNSTPQDNAHDQIYVLITTCIQLLAFYKKNKPVFDHLKTQPNDTELTAVEIDIIEVFTSVRSDYNLTSVIFEPLEQIPVTEFEKPFADWHPTVGWQNFERELIRIGNKARETREAILQRLADPTADQTLITTVLLPKNDAEQQANNVPSNAEILLNTQNLYLEFLNTIQNGSVDKNIVAFKNEKDAVCAPSDNLVFFVALPSTFSIKIDYWLKPNTPEDFMQGLLGDLKAWAVQSQILGKNITASELTAICMKYKAIQKVDVGLPADKFSLYTLNFEPLTAQPEGFLNWQSDAIPAGIYFDETLKNQRLINQELVFEEWEFPYLPLDEDDKKDPLKIPFWLTLNFKGYNE